MNMGETIFKLPSGKPLTKSIEFSDVEPTAKWLERLTGLPLCNNILSSVEDIDFVVDSTKIEMDQLIHMLSVFAKKTGQNANSWIKQKHNTIYFRCPIAGRIKCGFVQVNFRFFEQPSLAKFLFQQDDSTNYLCSTRNALIDSIAKSMGYAVMPDQGLVDAGTSQVITNDPDQIARVLLTPESVADDLGSVEKILEVLVDDPDKENKMSSFMDYAYENGIQVSYPINETSTGEVSFLARLRDRIVNRGMQVIVENAHIEHPEDLVFEYGSKGLQQAIDAIESIIRNPENVTIKWDGMPALIFGRNYSGEFVLTDKSAFDSKTYDGLATSPEDIAKIMSNRKGDRRELIQLYTNLFPLLEKTIPKDFEGYVKGDLLYSARPKVVNGEYVFTPNTVTYTVPTDSELGRKIGNSIVGIAIHSRVPYPGGVYTPITSEKLQQVRGVLMLDASIRDIQSININVNSIERIRRILDERGREIDKLFNPNELKNRKIANLPALMKQYINSRVRDGNLDNIVGQFPDWIKEKENMPKVQRIFDWLKQNRYGLVSAMRSFTEVTKIKNSIINQLDTQSGEVNANINGKNGHEGYVSDGLKFVDRLKFSSANFRKNSGGIR